MKGIMTLVVTGLFLVAPIAVLSQYDDNDNNKENDDSYGYDRSYDSDQDKGYESSFGNRYEYDLSDPSDRIMYDVDPNAQLRDSIDVNPLRDVERSIGEYGGGVLDDQ
ncbi:hypothetical protein ACFL07_01315 [Pseudomonadota bacterium]